jgi:peptidoglycan hydrolase-like protein with peptidoglycan-binding domain
MAPRIAKSLDVLRSQFNALAPKRDKSSDGWIGDVAHQSRQSDHNPNAAGVVTAFDLTHDPGDGIDCAKIAEMLRTHRDHRIEYVIWNRRIFNSRVSPWIWRTYGGSNPHNLHMHISVHNEEPLYDSAEPWAITLLPPTGEPNPVRPLLERGSEGEPVKEVQRILGIEVDGIYGEATEAAVINFQQRHEDLVSDGIVGPYTWQKLRPAPVAGKRFTKITATVFSDEAVAYPPFKADHTKPFVALPAAFKDPRPLVRVFGPKAPNGVVGSIGDKGPWYDGTAARPADPYWETGLRPRAESDDRTNDAGIDLNPLMAELVGIDGKGLVDWEFVDLIEKPEPKPAIEELLREMTAALRPILERRYGTV